MYKIKKMSEDVHTYLQGVLGLLEGLQSSPDDALYANKSHVNLLKSINSLLGSGDEITSDDAEKVLKVCLQNTLDMRSAPYTLSIISTLLSIQKEKPFVPSVDFLPSALAVLEFLKKSAADKTNTCIRTLAFQVLMAHTTPTLVNVVTNHSAVLFETFSLYYILHKDYADCKIEAFIILQLLKVLPDHEKSIFVKEGIPMWFDNILPCLMQVLESVDDRDKVETCLSYSEALTDQLILYDDYFEYPGWEQFLINIVDPKKYPQCIKSLLDNDKDTWYRVWIMLFKILQFRVTRAFGTYGTPINSLLPVVESAFKLENIQRIRAFACWNELIMNFLNNLDAQCLGKRLKLVLIPLKLNNAKTEDVAAAKFNSWWLLIRKFKPKLEKLAKEILLPFLNFLFGNRLLIKRPFWACQLSNYDMKQKCLEALIEIVGHGDCDGCTTAIQPLDGKAINTILLADHWNDWLFTLKTAISMVGTMKSFAARKRLRCLWKSFVLLMAELPDNSVRQDWFYDIINALSELVEESKINNDLVEIIMEDLTLPLYRDAKVNTLIDSSSLDHRPMHKIVVLTTGKIFDSFYKRYNPDELQKLLEPLVTTLVMESVVNPAYMVMLLDELPLANGSFKLWTALARKSTEADLCLQVFNALLRWPLKAYLAAENDIKDAALTWYTLYTTVHVKLDKIGFDNEISKLLTKPVEDNEASNYLVLFALIGVLKYKPDEDKLAKLEALTYEMNAYEEFELLIPALVDTLALMIEYSSTKMHESLAHITINCINNVLKLINSESKSNVNNQSVSRETAFSEARVNFPSIDKTVLIDTITTAMKTFLVNNTNESLKKEVQNVISLLEKSDDKPSVESPKKTDIPKEFASPKMQEVKITKKKEPSIVNTVVENGEEYVVVKSNWKFNPKNLTENQKEKFQRKRDIPALYQDLSQSQDEFKLSSWKTDSNSQDTSLSSAKSSKSASNNDIAEVLKNMSSTDVVPKIMENILDNAKNIQPKTDVTLPATVDKVLKVDKVITLQGTKSPRMALKDRVFRNVRNLIEKSSPPPNEVKDKDLIGLDNVCTSATSPTIKSSNEITENKGRMNQNEVAKNPEPKLMTEENAVMEKQETEYPVAFESSESVMKKVIIETVTQNQQCTTLICSPLSKTKKDNNIKNSAPLLSTKRPARMKRKPKKFDDSLLLAFKKSRHSNNESQGSQDLQDVQPKVTIALVHTPKDKNEETETVQTPNMVADIDITKKVDDNKPRKSNDVICDTVTNCDALKYKENVESHPPENVIVTPTTPISNKETEQTPDVPTTNVEVPTEKDKASEGFEIDLEKKMLEENEEVLKPTVKTPSNKLKEFSQQISSAKRKQHDVKDKKTEIVTTPLIKTRKAKLKIENIINAASMTPVSTVVDKSKDLEQETSVRKTTDVELETKKEDTKMEIVSTPMNKTKSKEIQQRSTKKNVAEEETNILNSKLESVTPTDKSKDLSPPILVNSKKATTETKSDNQEPVTPVIKPNDSVSKLSVKKAKKIEKELMIDMVEGHPFLKSQSEKRLTRKTIMEAENSNRRKSVAEKLNKSKLEATPKLSKKIKEKKTSPMNLVTVEDSQDRQRSSEEIAIDDPPCSEDIIESSQDSTMTTISVKSTKRTPKRQPIAVKKLNIETTKTQELIQDSEMYVPNDETYEKTDIELSQNKTVEVDKNITDLTENMDTEPMDEKASEQVIILDEAEPLPITINSEPVIGPETQELAEADTQPNDPNFLEKQCKQCAVVIMRQPLYSNIPSDSIEESVTEIQVAGDNITQSLSEAKRINIDETNDVSSPYKDDNVRKQDFLNNTLEISPIKVQSPDREKKSPSPETSSDFVVIKLSSPVHSNGEPFEKHGSPEFFTEDKVSPDKRDSSPPRVEVTVTNTSPSSSLSLKKNRPQVRPTGRAAQMLDLLCVTSDLKVTKVPERVETEEAKKTSAYQSTPARRNLRILYNSVGDSDMPEQNVEETNNFLKLKRALPTVSISPSGPILKRKLIDITDETTASPANKRKRVSFHDPPVSTTVSVQKYIEPLSLVRSPQSSAKKRQARLGIKSPKRLEDAFNLDSVLSKTVESFAEIATPTDDTQSTSLDVTPIVEVVKTSELNDTDPFYPELIDCKEPIQVIATELSSPAMCELFIKELEGTVDTIGDLATMTELEINRLCIKAPKIQVAKKVLSDYFNKRQTYNMVETVIEEAFSEPMTESLLDKTVSVEMQTDAVEISSAAIQTDIATAIPVSTQTDSTITAHTSMQTDESGSNTDDIISMFLTKKEEFVEKLTEKLDEESMKTIAEKLPLKSLLDLLINKSEDKGLINSILKLHSKDIPKENKVNAELSFVKDILCEMYESTDLLLLCSQMLQKIYDKADKRMLK